MGGPPNPTRAQRIVAGVFAALAGLILISILVHLAGDPATGFVSVFGRPGRFLVRAFHVAAVYPALYLVTAALLLVWRRTDLQHIVSLMLSVAPFLTLAIAARVGAQAEVADGSPLETLTRTFTSSGAATLFSLIALIEALLIVQLHLYLSGGIRVRPKRRQTGAGRHTTDQAEPEASRFAPAGADAGAEVAAGTAVPGAEVAAGAAAAGAGVSGEASSVPRAEVAGGPSSVPGAEVAAEAAAPGSGVFGGPSSVPGAEVAAGAVAPGAGVSGKASSVPGAEVAAGAAAALGAGFSGVASSVPGAGVAGEAGSVPGAGVSGGASSVPSAGVSGEASPVRSAEVAAGAAAAGAGVSGEASSVPGAGVSGGASSVPSAGVSGGPSSVPGAEVAAEAAAPGSGVFGGSSSVPGAGVSGGASSVPSAGVSGEASPVRSAEVAAGTAVPSAEVAAGTAAPSAGVAAGAAVPGAEATGRYAPDVVILHAGRFFGAARDDVSDATETADPSSSPKPEADPGDTNQTDLTKLESPSDLPRGDTDGDEPLTRDSRGADVAGPAGAPGSAVNAHASEATGAVDRPHADDGSVAADVSDATDDSRTTGVADAVGSTDSYRAAGTPYAADVSRSAEGFASADDHDATDPPDDLGPADDPGAADNPHAADIPLRASETPYAADISRSADDSGPGDEPDDLGTDEEVAEVVSGGGPAAEVRVEKAVRTRPVPRSAPSRTGWSAFDEESGIDDEDPPEDASGNEASDEEPFDDDWDDVPEGAGDDWDDDVPEGDGDDEDGDAGGDLDVGSPAEHPDPDDDTADGRGSSVPEASEDRASGDRTAAPAGSADSSPADAADPSSAGPESATGTSEETDHQIIVVPRRPPREPAPYERPPAALLDEHDTTDYWVIDDQTNRSADILKTTLEEFQIQAEVTGIRKGPVITMFEILPAPGVKLAKITNLSDNIALRLAAASVRIVAPIPGRHAVGIEIPNRERSIVSFSDLIQEKSFEDQRLEIPIALGKDIPGDTHIFDLTQTPHLLIAGATGSGKSVCVNSLICSILYRQHPADVKLMLIDPKIVELKLYNDIPHLLTPVVTEPQRALQALNWTLYEMERRYSMLDGLGVRDVKSYNRRITQRKLAQERMPYIVVVIDEFADIMASTGKEFETTVARLAAMSRAVGIHLVLATQRPSTDVITGLIKANIPSRIAFKTSSRVDSRIILDNIGADKLLGKGDMLFVSSWDPFPSRLQGAYLSEEEVERVVEYVKRWGEPEYLDEEIFFDDDDAEFDADEVEDPLLDEAIQIVTSARKASASYLQRRLKVGYNRAARMVEEMEQRGIVGPQNGSKPRDVLSSGRSMS